METLNSLIEALQILAPLYGDDSYSFHEGKFFVGDYEPDLLSSEDLRRLEELGWFESEESWSKFVD